VRDFYYTKVITFCGNDKKNVVCFFITAHAHSLSKLIIVCSERFGVRSKEKNKLKKKTRSLNKIQLVRGDFYIFNDTVHKILP
jgi:hypothetical protein